ncbi:HEAT repeat domain-containing protein [Halogeometricum borinquense]|uniref:HEAT repeat domain-containing protein n=1 Tax=Halogeometricum borinquense TaxID=60847 RepID=A0A6C0UEQ9_9EURY|nr:HEAT repeat domain-containing protein [Halogeometricum borinquense]QIB73657.1 HEAT repeat domain-containing protein [Halogeometricum borinquense]QIQ76987.1 HEAT repeat domain-containing protein [Halogeometricum borinquense]
MSDGDDETPDETSEKSETAAASESDDITAESLDERLDSAEEDLDAAETESDLDEVESTLDAVESDLDAADLPEPDEDDEDAEDPRADLESRLSDLRDDLESQRGPYAEDVVDDIESAQSKISDTQWTDRGEGEIVDVVESFADDVNDTLDASVSVSGDDEAALTAALDDAISAVESAGLDADEDAETIASLLEVTDELEAGLEDAEEWDDLETNEKLQAQGFYDVLGHYKDYPPELSALKEWEKRGRADMILLAKDNLQSEFMQEYCMEAFVRMGDPAVFDEMHQLAQRRDKTAIKALGKMGADAEEAVETLVEYVDTDSDPALQKVTFKALGEIGSAEATQAIADKLVMDNENVRPFAARALGLLGDTRAIDPLADTLADDEDNTVRAAAAWALRQIGTEEALETAADYTDEQSYLVQHEAELARERLGDADADAPTA